LNLIFRQFIEKMEKENQVNTAPVEPVVTETLESPVLTSSHDPAERRRLMLEAAQRRAEMSKKEQ
jgi:hypothetical protein